jgi:NAD-dependent dihydropyrimidine dehydrogenase PreA subunit
MAKPKIDYDKCTNCGTCIEACPVEVFAKEGEKVEIKNPKECISCRSCEIQCPANAIEIEE